MEDNPRITANEIAKKFAISKSTVSQVLSKHEALSEEADKEIMTKHFADIDLEQLQNVL